MKTFHITNLIAAQQQSKQAYFEFLRVLTLSAGIYSLPAGGVDPQKPHSEDELYYIITGKAMIQVGDEACPVEPGTLVFVAAGVDHRFHNITEDLQVLVLFAPAEYLQSGHQMGIGKNHP